MNKLLLVVDMQNDFISGSLGSEQAMAIVPKVVQKINTYKKNNLPVYYTLDTHDKDYLNTNEGQHLPIPHCILGTDGHKLYKEIADDIASIKNTNEFQKHTFGSVELAKQLEAYGEAIREVEIVGVVTDICIISNALLLKAHLPKAEIIVDVSCCAGSSSLMQLAAIAVMKSCQITIVGENNE